MAGLAGAGELWGAEADYSGGGVPVLTNAAQLREAVEGERFERYTVELEARVLWSNKRGKELFLRDGTGGVLVRVDYSGDYWPGAGERVRIEGEEVSGGRGRLGEAVVDNDGVHGMREESGEAYLTAGWHPLRLEWFNGKAGSGLVVEYQGPGLARQRIPGSALWREGPGSGGRVPGLDYRCYEGDWKTLPDFTALQPVGVGSVADFDLGVRMRANDVGLEFRGFLQAPRAGAYKFWTRSDDGSRLFVGRSSLRMGPLGSGGAGFPEPLALAPGQVLRPEQEDRWAQMEGTVTFAGEAEGETQLEVSSEAGHLEAQVSEPLGMPVWLMMNSRVRLTGLCRGSYAMDGRRVAGKLLVSGWEQVQVLEFASTLWEEYPLQAMGELEGTNGPGGGEGVAHLRGEICSREPFTLADETGQMRFETLGPVAGELGAALEVLGHWRQEGTNRVLSGMYRRVPRGEAEATNTLPLLTTADQIKRLDRKEAGRGYPVKIRGVIIGLGPSGGLALQDSTRAVHINWRSAIKNPLPHVGEFWEIEGKTTVGFAPQVWPRRVRYLGSGTLPEPLRPTWDQLSNGSLEMQYVEVQGVITAIAPEGVAFLTRSGKITIRFPGVNSATLARYEDALVRVRGCISPLYETGTQQTRVGQIRLFSATFQVEEPAPADPFAAPLKRAGDVLLYDASARPMQRIRVTGQVVHERDGEYFLTDGGVGLRCELRASTRLEPGDLAEVVGFVDLSGAVPTLREAVGRRTGHAALPGASALAETNLLNGRYDSTLVRVRARLESLNDNPREQTLTLQAGDREFLARLRTSRGRVGRIAPGSVLEVTGVYAGQGGNRRLARDIDAFELYLNGPGEVRILERPSWWTARHSAAVVGAMACLILAGLVWIALLRRQVEERSLQLADQIRRHEQSERQRALDADRARIARDLHDDLGASLTEIGLLAQAGSGALPTLERAHQRFGTIREKASQMVEALDVIVWLVNPRKDTLPSLATYFASYAEEYLSASGMGCHLQIPIDLPPLPLASELRQGLFLAVKEALNNAVRHSRATQVEITLKLAGDELEIVIADNGKGFDLRAPVSGNGLSNLCERLSRFGGGCEMVSRPGGGTKVSLHLPVGSPKASL